MWWTLLWSVLVLEAWSQKTQLAQEGKYNEHLPRVESYNDSDRPDPPDHLDNVGRQRVEESHSPLSLIEIFVDKWTRKGFDTQMRLDMVDHVIAALNNLSTAPPEALVLVGTAS